MKEFRVEIFAADKVFYRGPALQLNIPTPDGMYGILADHSNTICAIEPGKMEIDILGLHEELLVSKGLFKIEEGQVLVLVHSCERPDEVDEARARRAKEEAERILKQKQSYKEYHIAEAGLMRAMNRLKYKKKK